MFKTAMIIYNFLFPVVFLLYFPFYRRKLEKRGNYKDGFDERFGKFSDEKCKRLSQLKNPVWIHAVSVGETVVSLSFIQKWREQYPGQDIILSTTTSTGQKIARDKAPDDVVIIYSPLDMGYAVSRSLDLIKPSKYIIFEVEIWPNIISKCHKRGIPVSLINCRISDKSYKGFKKHKWFFKRIFSFFSLIAVQSQTDADRINQIVEKEGTAKICGTMKFDQITDCNQQSMAEIKAVFEDNSLIFTAASIHPGEPEILLRAYKKLNEQHPNLKLIMVPRHVEKIDYFCDLLDQSELPYIRLSEERQKPSGKTYDILIADTTGEMMSILANSDIVYIGKSMGGNCGGHNIIEPAIFGKAILFGKDMQNFRLVVDAFKQANAVIELNNEAELTNKLEELLNNESERERLAAASRAVVEAERGAIDKTIAVLNR